MNTVRRIAKNTLSLFIAQFFVSILSLILSISIARSLGDTVFGKYSFAIVFVSFFTIFSDLGYNTLLIRDVARNKSRANRYLNNIMSIRGVLSVIIFVFIVIIINVMGYPADTKNVVYLFGISALLVSLSDVFRVMFRAFEKMEYEAFIRIFITIIKVSLGLLVLFLGYGLMELALVFLLTGVFDLLFTFLIYEKKLMKSKTELDFGFWRKTIKIALPLSMLSIFSLIYVRIDTIMLSVMKEYAVVGWYNAAYNLVLSFKAIPHIFLNALLPLMSYYYVSSKSSLKITYEKSLKYLLILALPIAVGITLLADRFILLFYGQQFSNSIIALQILAWDVLLIFLCSPHGAILVSMDRQNVMAAILGLTALINIVLNSILISPLSYVGAAIATIVTETILLVLYVYFISKYLHTIAFHKIIIRPIIAVSVMGLFLYFFRSINLYLLIISAAGLYFIILYLVRGISKKDISLFKKIFKKQKEEI